MNMDKLKNYKVVEYKKTNEFFIYDTRTYKAYSIVDESRREEIRKNYTELYVHHNYDPVERVTIRVTGRCNMACMHCYVGKQLKPTSLHVSMLDKLFSELASMGGLTVGLTGGEPLLHESIVEIVERATHYNLGVSLETNGLLLTNEMVRDLSSVGLHEFRISFDGFSKLSYQKMRGRASDFLQVKTNIENLVKSTVFTGIVTINTVISRLNINDLFNMLDFLASQRKTIIWQLNYINFLGNAKCNTDVLQVQTPFLKKIVEQLKRRAHGSKVLIKICDFLKEKIIPQYKYVCCGHVGELHRFATIHFDGTVNPCPNIWDKEMGNLINNNFRNIWLSKRMRDFKRNLIPDTFCENCNQCQDEVLLVTPCRCEKLRSYLKEKFLNIEFT